MFTFSMYVLALWGFGGVGTEVSIDKTELTSQDACHHRKARLCHRLYHN